MDIVVQSNSIIVESNILGRKIQNMCEDNLSSTELTAFKCGLAEVAEAFGLGGHALPKYYFYAEAWYLRDLALTPMSL